MNVPRYAAFSGEILRRLNTRPHTVITYCVNLLYSFGVESERSAGVVVRKDDEPDLAWVKLRCRPPRRERTDMKTLLNLVNLKLS